MAEPSEQSESMEEILQSIKRIMDDNTIGEPKPAAESDVFDLTEVVETGEEPATTAAEHLETFNAPNAMEAVASVFDEPKKAPPKRVSMPIDDGLMSEQSVTAAASAFKQITDSTQKDYSIPTIPSPMFRSGNTVEDLVIEALRPMLKEWLDTNLPVIVQKFVEKEIKRIVNMHND